MHRPLEMVGKRMPIHDTEWKPWHLDKHLPQDLRASEQLIRSHLNLSIFLLDYAESGECHQRDQVPVKEMPGWGLRPARLCLQSFGSQTTLGEHLLSRNLHLFLSAESGVVASGDGPSQH